MDYNQIRIRDNAILRVIKIEPEQLDWMDKHLKKYPASEQKKIVIKKIFGSPCLFVMARQLSINGAIDVKLIF